MTLVAGVDSSTQSCKVVICDAASGQVLRFGSAPHPNGTEVNPEHWWLALQQAIEAAGGLADVDAIAIAGQQHGMVLLDKEGEVIRDALLWNDLRSAESAAELIADLTTKELSGQESWVQRTGLVPVASFTASKLRLVARNEPDILARAAAVCLPHDWLTWKLAEQTDIGALNTDRSDASGTGYFSPETGEYDLELLEIATLGKKLLLPALVGFGQAAYQSKSLTFAGGMGDNAAAALGVGIDLGDILISIGTSAVVSTLRDGQTKDATGIVSGFASALDQAFLPLACTLNGAEIFDKYANLFSITHEELSDLALSAEIGSHGVVTIPFFNGERTPNLPNATAEIVGLSLTNFNQPNLFRSLFEGLLCGLADAIKMISPEGQGRAFLVGGAARSEALRAIAPIIFGREVLVPQPNEYVAMGAAKQAAASIGLSISNWKRTGDLEYKGKHAPWILSRYQAEVENLIKTSSS